MKTININFTLTDSEHEFLVAGKCDKPNAQRIKMMLLREAAKNLRYWSESVLKYADEGSSPKAAGHYHVNTKAELRELNRQRRADGLITGGVRKVEIKVKPRKYPHLPAKTERAMADYERKAVSAVLTRTVASGSGLKPKRGAKPMATDGSAQPDWLDDDNIDKLRQ